MTADGIDQQPEVIEFFVPGDPVSQTRPRTFWQKKRDGTPAEKPTTMGSSPDCRNWRETVKVVALSRRPEVPAEGPITLTLIFVFQRPDTHRSPVTGDLNAQGRRQPRPIGRRDFDNLTKAITDSLEGIFYRNDAQIVTCLVEKRWCSQETGPGVFVTIRKCEVRGE